MGRQAYREATSVVIALTSNPDQLASWLPNIEIAFFKWKGIKKGEWGIYSEPSLELPPSCQQNEIPPPLLKCALLTEDVGRKQRNTYSQ
jgi:hypothetical protein